MRYQLTSKIFWNLTNSQWIPTIHFHTEAAAKAKACPPCILIFLQLEWLLRQFFCYGVVVVVSKYFWRVTLQLRLVDFHVQPWRKDILKVFTKSLPRNLASVYTMKQLPSKLGVVHDHDTGKIKAVRHQTAVQAYVRMIYLNEPKDVQPHDDFSHVFCQGWIT